MNKVFKHSKLFRHKWKYLGEGLCRRCVECDLRQVWNIKKHKYVKYNYVGSKK